MEKLECWKQMLLYISIGILTLKYKADLVAYNGGDVCVVDDFDFTPLLIVTHTCDSRMGFHHHHRQKKKIFVIPCFISFIHSIVSMMTLLPVVLLAKDGDCWIVDTGTSKSSSQIHKWDPKIPTPSTILNVTTHNPFNFIAYQFFGNEQPTSLCRKYEINISKVTRIDYAASVPYH